MSAPTGRLADVSAAVLTSGAGNGSAHRANALAALLDRMFEDVLVVGGDPDPAAPGRRIAGGSDGALHDALSALRAARGERVLLVSADRPRVTPELLLALVAWPAADAVVARDAAGNGDPVCGVYRRDPALAAAGARLAAGERALDGWLDALDVSELPAEVVRELSAPG